MAVLADSFLADLDELSDHEAEILSDKNAADMEVEEHIDGSVENLNDLDSVSKLQKTNRFIDVLHKVEEALKRSSSDFSVHEFDSETDLSDYQLIMDSNALSIEIDDEILTIYNFIRDRYRSKFPELDSVIHDPINYARVVKKIGNETDLTLVDLDSLEISRSIIRVFTITSSTTINKKLPEEVLIKTIEACDRVIALDSAKKKVIEFVKSRMCYIAPNISTIIGSDVAGKLIVTAGGLVDLANMPSCNVMLLGSKRKNLAGFSTATSQFRVGFIAQTDIIQKDTPLSLRMRACRLVAAKCTLAARVDSIRGDSSGSTGRILRDEIYRKIEKWQEPSRAIKRKQPLPVPSFETKKRRGGRRVRKMKERYAVTDMRKLANRMQFGVPEEDSYLGDGYEMLGLRSKVAVKVAKKSKEKKHYGRNGTTATSGLISSIAFTPVQGIELINPHAHAMQLGSGTQSTYFSETGTFSKI